MFGFLNVYKPVGMTSHDVVAILRRVTKVKQVGHTGTLDPFAEGVLPICIGKSTRLIEYLEDDKAYLGTFCFGKSTTTYDVEGEVVEVFENKITQEILEDNLKDFEGEIEQMPPIYSAIKVNGKKLYDYAREGKEVEIQSRKVFVEKIELKSFDYEKQTAEIYIKCSKGTYIRSIANDLGKKMKNGAYLSKLVRVQAGKFMIDSAIKLEELDTKEKVEQNLLNPILFLSQYKEQKLNEVELKRISNGLNIYNRVDAKDEIVVLTKDSQLIAIARDRYDGLRPIKVIR